MNGRRWSGSCLVAAFVATLVVHACGHGHDHAAGEPHGHPHGEPAGHGHAPAAEEEIAIAITRWSPSYELFAEHTAAIVGRESRMAAHLTVLEGFTALEVAHVSLEVDGPNGASIRASVDGAAQPGIFRFTFTPRVAGTYRGRMVVRVGERSEPIAPIEIEAYPDYARARAANPETEDPPGRITFLKEQAWRVPFATVSVVTGDLAPTVELTGTIATPPGGTAEVGSPVVGRVVAPRDGLPLLGSSVRRGAVLATIAPTPSAPEAGAATTLGIAEARSRVAAAEATLARAERLIADRAIAQREVDDARREVSVARAALAAAVQSRRVFVGALSGRGAGTFRLTSPIDGVLVEVAARPGLTAEPGTTLFRIVDTTRLWIVARVLEQDAPRLRTDVDARYQLLGVDEWLPIDLSGPDASASLVTVGRVVDPRSRTVDLVYALHAPDPRSRVGGAVRVQVPIGDRFSGLAIPRAAIVDDDGRDVVYVQVEGESFEERIVRTGVRSGDLVGVISGLRAGERIVTTGANLVRLAARSGAVPAHGHVH